MKSMDLPMYIINKYNNDDIKIYNIGIDTAINYVNQ